MSAAQLKRFVSLLHNVAIVTMHQTDPDRDRGRAAADTKRAAQAILDASSSGAKPLGAAI
jgi:hypothetical protein